ncbi:hypothetical protein [Neolewinella persica]|uniref:hypothetical protein n=1 Tax=Neolewinella persica TaxID=70998 RepID=UPI0012FC5074|nr:hypothetical protein [Neolewinella persica]
MRYFWLLSSFYVFLLIISSCTSDVLPEPVILPCDGETPTYEADVRDIIERSCAYSGCHLGGAPGIYDSYLGLISDLESGLFRQRVIDVRDDATIGMPPNYAPQDRPEDLTEEELIIITCWLDAGFPEQ